MLSEPTTVVWDNPHGLAVLEANLAEALLARRWAKEVTSEAFDWWNSQFATDAPAATSDGGGDAGDKGNLEPEKDKTPAPATTPAPTPAPANASEPPKVEPVKEEPKAEPKKAEPEKVDPKPAAKVEEKPTQKPAATKEELLKRAEAEAAGNKK